MGARGALGVARFGADGGADLVGLGGTVCASDLFAGDVRGPGAIPGNLLPRGELEGAGGDDGARQGRSHPPAEPFHQAGAGAAPRPPVPRAVERRNKMKRPRIEVNLSELDQLLD